MIPISLDKFCKKYIQINKGENLEDLKERLQNAVKRKKEGAKYQFRGQKIWAIGSAIIFKGYFIYKW